MKILKEGKRPEDWMPPWWAGKRLRCQCACEFELEESDVPDDHPSMWTAIFNCPCCGKRNHLAATLEEITHVQDLKAAEKSGGPSALEVLRKERGLLPFMHPVG